MNNSKLVKIYEKSFKTICSVGVYFSFYPEFLRSKYLATVLFILKIQTFISYILLMLLLFVNCFPQNLFFHIWLLQSAKFQSKRMFTRDPKRNIPETKFQPTIKEILFTLLPIAGEMKWISFRGWSEISVPLSKSRSFLLTHVQMFPFIWFHFG